MKTKETMEKQKKWTFPPDAPAEVFNCLKDYPRSVVQILWNRGIIGSNQFTNGTNVTNLPFFVGATNDKKASEGQANIQMGGWIPAVAGMTKEGEGSLDKDCPEYNPNGLGMTEQVENFLDPDYEGNLHDPYLLKDMDKAVERILSAIKGKEKICIYGDYDVDGVTATALLSDTFDKLGADFMTYIPSRHDEGYGLNKEAIDEIGKNGTKLIVTVDCGIRSFEEVEYANSKDIDVIVTDHHEVGLQFAAGSSQKEDSKSGQQALPEATAVVNPRREDCAYPFKDLAGVGVAFKLACAILAKGQTLSKGWEKWLLDLVALGTVCDVVFLTGENRVLVKYGLTVLSRTKREGIKALAYSAGVNIENISSHNLGFHLGPRLNASGRLETAKMSLDLLLSKDKVEAENIAFKLSKLNKERQDMTRKILEEARKEIEGLGEKQSIYLLKSKNWPAGVVGIVASRLMDECGCPVLLMEEGDEESKGSARSIDSFSIISALEKCEELLVRYGGHKKAAGLTVKNEHFILLNNKLIQIAKENIKEEDLVPEIHIDSEIAISEVNDELNIFLKKIEPYGLGNRKPVFVLKGAEVDSAVLVGADKDHLKLKVTDGGKTINGIYFNYGTELQLKKGDGVDIVFTVSENEWNGRVSLEMMVVDMVKVKISKVKI